MGCAVPVDGKSHIEPKPSFLSRKDIPMIPVADAGGEFGLHPVTQPNTVIARAGRLLPVAKRNTDLFLPDGKGIREREYRNITPVTDARTAQVCMTEAGNTVAAIMITAAPVPAAGAVIRTQLDHSEGDCCPGVYMTVTTGTQKRIYETGVCLGR